MVLRLRQYTRGVSTHSRPKAAGPAAEFGDVALVVSTHSRPKAAGKWLRLLQYLEQFQHTAARRRLAAARAGCSGRRWFQHTAARRRLGLIIGQFALGVVVSTHSRPKAAGKPCFNPYRKMRFQHTAARRRLEPFVRSLA